MFREMRKTIFCDIDGTIFVHRSNLEAMLMMEPVLLPFVSFRFMEWREKDYYIVLTTARPEGCRRRTEEQLAKLGLFWDQLIMGLPVGPRVVINDTKTSGQVTAIAVPVDRDKGLRDVEV